MAARSLNISRKLFLCTYDVADDKRRTRLFELLKDHGEHVQYSVFLCSLSRVEAQRLSLRAAEIVHHKEDQLLVIRLGPDNPDWTANLSCIGKLWTPAIRSHII